MKGYLPNLVLPLLILVVLPCCSSCSSNPAARHTELRELMNIKASLDPHGKHLPSWVASGNPCGGKFAGVACNEYNRVANISLQGIGLAGKLTPVVAQLKCLTGLYLHYNSLIGEIPPEIAELTELTDIYLNFNNLTGPIPSTIGNMASLQALLLSNNQLSGNIPSTMGSLKNLNHLALEHNRLTGQIPSSLGKLRSLKWLSLGFNQLSGQIPDTLANNTSLQTLEVQSNNLSGVIPSGLKRKDLQFQFDNNEGLCGASFPTLGACTTPNNNQYQYSAGHGGLTSKPQSAGFNLTCNHANCSGTPSKLPKIGLVSGLIAIAVGMTAAASLVIFRHRRRKPKVRSGSSDAATTEDRSSMDRAKDLTDRSPSSLDRYPSAWDPSNISHEGSGGSFNGGAHLQGSSSRFNLEEVESATHHFSEVNLLGKSKFCGVYRGVLKDGSSVAVKCIGKMSCKSEEEELLKGLSLLHSLQHENLVELKGFCRSKARGECFLIYNFVPGGTLSRYLDGDVGSGTAGVLDWKTRVSIIHGVAKGIRYLHSNETNKPPIIHQNISVEKVLLGQNMSPLIMDAGVLKLLADDVVYSALKASAALGYMAPEYITTGRFTEKSDVYAYGVIIFQLLCGKTKLPGSTRVAAEAGKLEEFMDPKLEGDFVETKARFLTRIALDCTNEDPERRPSMVSVVRELKKEEKGG